MKLGRNDQCHCGSGKKYKKCHMQMDASEQREVRQLEGGAAVLEFYSKKLNSDMAPKALEHPAAQAASRSWFGDTNAAALDDAAFIQHILYDLSVGAQGPLIREATLSDASIDASQVKALGDALADTHLSLLEVTESKRGRGVRLLDRLTNESVFVDAAQLADTLEPMEVLLGRVGTWDDKKVLLPGWEKVWFRGRKAVIRECLAAMAEDGLMEDDEADVRQIWLRRQAHQVALRTREASPK
jgi:hypothetical protein